MLEEDLWNPKMAAARALVARFINVRVLVETPLGVVDGLLRRVNNSRYGEFRSLVLEAGPSS
jgi:hypothetical protein